MTLSQGFWELVFQGLESETNSWWMPGWMPSIKRSLFSHPKATLLIPPKQPTNRGSDIQMYEHIKAILTQIATCP